MKRKTAMIQASGRSSRVGLATAVVIVLAIGYAALAEDATPVKPERDTAAPFETSAAEVPPRIVTITPATGGTDVDPDTSEIVVTFDRDMARGFSWTGGGSNYPPIAE